jgi:hypothetical protein
MAANAASREIMRLAEARVHEAGDSDDLARWVLSRWNDRGLARNGGLIESEEDGAEEGCRLFIRVGLEIRMYMMTKAEPTAENRPAYGGR